MPRGPRDAGAARLGPRRDPSPRGPRSCAPSAWNVGGSEDGRHVGHDNFQKMSARSSEVGLVLDPGFEAHRTGPGHPERPERTAAVRARLEGDGLAARCFAIAPEPAGDEVLTLVHDPDHVARVSEACRKGAHFLDSMDTAISPESDGVARLAAG